MTLAAGAGLAAVAFAVCSALERAGETAVLCGGSAAAYYAADRYASRDVDFVLHGAAARRTVDRALAQIGYERAAGGWWYSHPLLPFTIDFPVGPLAIGREKITAWRTERRGDEILHLLAPLDVVRDRFLHYWAWGDEGALAVAVAVARRRAADVDLVAFRAWTEREMRADGSYGPSEIGRFLRALDADSHAGLAGYGTDASTIRGWPSA